MSVTSKPTVLVVVMLSVVAPLKNNDKINTLISDHFRLRNGHDIRRRRPLHPPILGHPGVSVIKNLLLCCQCCNKNKDAPYEIFQVGKLKLGVIFDAKKY